MTFVTPCKTVSSSIWISTTFFKNNNRTTVVLVLKVMIKIGNFFTYNTANGVSMYLETYIRNDLSLKTTTITRTSYHADIN